MASISVSATVGGWTLESLLGGPLRSRSRYAVCDVGSLLTAGYELLPTGLVPHFDIVLQAATLGECERLLAHFSLPHDYPHKRRR